MVKKSNNESKQSSQSYQDWLRERSILQGLNRFKELFSSHDRQWRCPFGRSANKRILEGSSVWFSTYPDSVIGGDGETPLQVLGDSELQKALSRIGILGIHTGPMKLSGAVAGKDYSPSIDGHFDRIESRIDPNYGTEADYKALVERAVAHNISIIGDIVPGHTGKGPDFRLAEMNDPDYRGIFNMLEIAPEHWSLMPNIKPGRDSQNLSVKESLALKDAGYRIIGPLDVEVFARPGIKETSWSATDVTLGVDGIERRWVYLHIFKEGQPSLNWMDPSFGANRLITADTLHTLHGLGVKGLRLDATMFLGVEPREDGKKGWLGGHPLSNHVTDNLGMMIRKFGGFSFQELNSDFITMRESLSSGPEFNYDFPTRPAYLYALTIEDAGPLRLTLREMLNYEIQPNRLVHALQNHDELMLEATHFAVCADKTFSYEGVDILGRDLFAKISNAVLDKTVEGPQKYNHSCAMSPGVCSTFTGLIAAQLGYDDILSLSDDQVENIKRRHLLAAAYNALQGGIFAVSGWDLVGALPVDQSDISELMADNDARWINRGGYDLMGRAPEKAESYEGMPRARALYGDLKEQENSPESFVSQLKVLLDVRKEHAVSSATLIDVPEVDHAAVIIMMHETNGAKLITAINFGGEPVQHAIKLENAEADIDCVWSLTDGAKSQRLSIEDSGEFLIDLAPYDAQLLVCGV